MKFAPQIKPFKHRQFIDYLKGQKVYPINILISLVGYCNADCDWCFYKNQKDLIHIDLLALIRFQNELAGVGVKAITWTGGGEPTLHSKFSKISDHTKFIGIQQGLFTNALAFPKYNPSNMLWIRVSKTNHLFNILNLKKLRECKSIGLNINYKGNDDLIMQSLLIVHKLNLDYLQVRPALNLESLKTLYKMPNIKDEKLLLTLYKFDQSNKDRNYNKCYGYHLVPFVWHNGDYAVCAYHKDNKDYVLGNIYSDSIHKIVLKLPLCINVANDCQTCCKNHLLNNLINSFNNMLDINFI